MVLPVMHFKRIQFREQRSFGKKGNKEVERPRSKSPGVKPAEISEQKQVSSGPEEETLMGDKTRNDSNPSETKETKEQETKEQKPVSSGSTSKETEDQTLNDLNDTLKARGGPEPVNYDPMKSVSNAIADIEKSMAAHSEPSKVPTYGAKIATNQEPKLLNSREPHPRAVNNQQWQQFRPKVVKTLPTAPVYSKQEIEFCDGRDRGPKLQQTLLSRVRRPPPPTSSITVGVTDMKRLELVPEDNAVDTYQEAASVASAASAGAVGTQNSESLSSKSSDSNLPNLPDATSFIFTGEEPVVLFGPVPPATAQWAVSPVRQQVPQVPSREERSMSMTHKPADLPLNQTESSV